MAFRDIDYSLRVNGDLSVPSHSFKVGSNITLNNADGKVSATQFAGNGSLLTNLSSSAMTDVLLLNGNRAMTGKLVLADQEIRLRTPTDANHYIRFDSAINGPRIAGYVGVELYAAGGTNTSLAKFTTTDSNIYKPLTVATSVTSTTINATGNLQEAGANLSSKYLQLAGGVLTGDLTIDSGANTTVTLRSADTGESVLNLIGVNQGTGRIYVGQNMSYGGGMEYNGDNNPASTGSFQDFLTFFRVNAGVTDWTARNSYDSNDWEFRGNLKATSFNVGTTPVIETDARIDWNKIKNTPATYTPSSHTHDDRYYTETEMDTKLSGKSDTTHLHDDRYYTETEMDTKLSDKSDTTHLHDDRYYTEAEVDTKLQQVIDYGQAQYTLSGGGTITWSTDYHLKWTQRFIAIPIDKDQASSGFLEVNMPASGTVIQGLGGSPNVTVTASGIPLPTWSGLYAKHIIGGLYTEVTLYVVNYNSAISGMIEPNMIFIALRNNDRQTLKLGLGDVLGTGDSIVNGRRSVSNVNGLQTALDGKEATFTKNTAFNKNFGTAAGTVAEGNHLHDDRYYTETEMDTKLGGKSDATHLHDDRYYTETEMDTKLGGKSDTTHTHTFVSLTSKPTTLSGYGITDAATSTHLHDDRYYTETEVDGKLQDVKSYVQSRGETVVTNGTGLLGDNTNFSSFTFDPVNVYAGKGSFYVSAYNTSRMSDELIPVNPNEEYRLTVMAKSNPYVGARTYIGITPYDIDGLAVYPQYYFGSKYNVVELTQDLAPGATQIHVSDVSQFMDQYAEDVNGNASHYHSLLFYGYRNSYGYEYPAGSYSRLLLSNGWLQGTIDRVNNIIHLKSALAVSNPQDPNGIWRMGHKVSPTHYGGTYKYITASNVQIPAEWTQYTGTISGIGVGERNFPPGTANVRLLFLANREVQGGATNFGNISFSLDVKTASEVNEGDSTTLANAKTYTEGYTYSKAESNANYEPKGTLHDDRYYTESEMDTKLGTKSDNGHTHTFASLTSRPTTLSGYGITDASLNTHTHTFASLTSKPTTLSGYGITDAATSTHNHDTTYFKLAGGTLTGDLTISTNLADSLKLTRTSTVANVGIQFANTASSVYAGASIVSATSKFFAVGTTADITTGKFKVNADTGETSINGNTVWHEGNLTPANKADKTTTVSAGTGLTGGGDLSANRTLNVDLVGTGVATTVARSDHNHDTTYAPLSHTHTFASLTSRPTTLSGYGITDAATSTHNHDTTYAKRGTRNESVAAIDKRAWTPTELSTSTKEVTFAFTSLNNNSTAPYADAIVMGTYGDSSAGGNNMLLAAKDGSGLYLRYGGWNAASWSWMKKLAFDEEKADKAITLTAGTGLTGGGDLSANRTLAVSFGTAAGTVAEGNHGHAISAITNLQTALDGKSATTHTHAFSELTSKPTTLSGYGITDAAGSVHSHTASDITDLQGKLDERIPFAVSGALDVNSTSNGNKLFVGSSGGWTNRGPTGHNGNALLSMNTHAGSYYSQLWFDTNRDEFYHRSIDAGAIRTWRKVWTEGNFSPADKADASTLTTHMNDATIHKSWNNWKTAVNDLLVNDKRAIVNATGTNKLTINYGGDFVNGVEIAGTLTNDGKQVWHAGNFTPSDYVSSGNSQTVGSGFTVKGRLLVGNISGITGDAVLYDDAGGATIHLDGNSSGIESSSATKIHLQGSGNATFKETVTAKNFTATTGATIPSLNVTSINSVNEKNFTKNDSIVDNTGWGIVSGLEGIAYGGELHVDPGVAYTKSGRRVELVARAKVNITSAPASGTRYDVLYIKGPSASTEEGNFGYFEGTVGGTAAGTIADPALSDSVILATVTRVVAQASLTQSDINSSVRDSGTTAGRKPFYMEQATKDVKVRYELHANKFKEGGSYLNAIYATLTGGNTFNANQKFNGRVHISATGTMGLSATSGNYALRVGTDSSYLAMDSNEILATGDLNIQSSLDMNIYANTIVMHSKVKAANNAKTLTIPAGQTSVTWTHNYGAVSYAVNLTTNSFERHIRWKDKTANSVTIEIDDPSTQETLVDCILIGY